MSIIDLYIKYSLAKVAFVKRHKKLVYATFFICLALLVLTSRSLVFFNSRINQIVDDSQSEVDRSSGQEQMKYIEIVSESGGEYSISMGIPKLKETDQASLLASEEMKNYFLKQAESYKAKFESDKIKEGTNTILSEQNFYSADTFTFVGKRFITFSTEEIASSQFQAGPQKHMTYFSYDRELKKLVTLSDVFVTSDAFYKKVSDLVYEAILPELDTIMFYNVGRQLNDKDKEIVKITLSYKQDSFDLFAISDDDVLFSFNPFTFSDGVPFSQTVSVRVPFSELKEFKK